MTTKEGRRKPALFPFQVLCRLMTIAVHVLLLRHTSRRQQGCCVTCGLQLPGGFQALDSTLWLMKISFVLALSISASIALTPHAKAALPVPIQAQLPVGEGACSQSIVVSNHNGAPLGTLPHPDPECGPFHGGDVWVSVVAPASGELVIGGGYSDLGLTRMAFYAWRRAQLVPLACAWPSTLHEVPETRLSGLNPGELILVQIWDGGNDQKGKAWLCAYDPAVRPGANTEIYTPENGSMVRIDDANGSAVLYPNPASDYAVISWSDTTPLHSLPLTDMQGRLWSVPVHEKGQGLELDLSQLPEGWYGLRIRSGDAWVQRSLLVQR